MAWVMSVVAVWVAMSWLAWVRQAMGWGQSSPAAVQAGHADLHGSNDARPGRRSAVDTGFAQDMSLHHEQALTMARLALSRGSPRVQALAQGIVNQQLRELGVMQGWLMLWDAPLMAGRDDMAWMRDAYARSPQREPEYDRFIEGCIRGDGMPGLATPAQLEALADVRNEAAFDHAFLALMVRHHQGAVVMARFASEHAGLATVRDFARGVAAEQQQELGQMTVWWRQGGSRR